MKTPDGGRKVVKYSIFQIVRLVYTLGLSNSRKTFFHQYLRELVSCVAQIGDEYYITLVISYLNCV